MIGYVSLQEAAKKQNITIQSLSHWVKKLNIEVQAFNQNEKKLGRRQKFIKIKDYYKINRRRDKSLSKHEDKTKIDDMPYKKTAAFSFLSTKFGEKKT